MAWRAKDTHEDALHRAGCGLHTALGVLLGELPDALFTMAILVVEEFVDERGSSSPLHVFKEKRICARIDL
jgi:hypothetical protein